VSLERVTVLTGVTGFLGQELLGELLSAHPGERIVALIRPSRGVGAGERLQNLLTARFPDAVERERMARRIVAIEADLDHDDSELATRVLRAVGDLPSRVIHGAANVAFDEPLEAARNINVQGTRRMLEVARALASSGRFGRFAYVGTAFVAGLRSGIVYENEVDVGQGFTNTYEQSKLEAEQLVRASADELPVTVLRPSIVAGRASTGETSSFKVLYWPLKVFARRLVLCIPGDPEAMYDIVPVDFVVEALLHILERKDSVGGCYHLTAGQAISLGRLVRMAAELFELRRIPPYVSARRFYGLVRPVLWLTLIGPMRRVMTTADVYIPYFSKKLIFDNRATIEALRHSGIALPDVESYMKTIFSYAKATDFGRRSIGGPDSKETRDGVRE